MNEFNLKPNVCAICGKEYQEKLNVMRIIRQKKNLYMEVPLCEKHWNEGKQMIDSEFSRLFIRVE